MGRKYLPTMSELIDRLSIALMKSIFIPENKSEYEKEMSDIIHDLNSEIKIINVGEFIKAVQVNMLANRVIWENESRARLGLEDQDKYLKFTHSINGVRNNAKNVISKQLGEREDFKVDCLAKEFIEDNSLGDWRIK